MKVINLLKIKRHQKLLGWINRVALWGFFFSIAVFVGTIIYALIMIILKDGYWKILLATSISTLCFFVIFHFTVEWDFGDSEVESDD